MKFIFTPWDKSCQDPYEDVVEGDFNWGNGTDKGLKPNIANTISIALPNERLCWSRLFKKYGGTSTYDHKSIHG